MFSCKRWTLSTTAPRLRKTSGWNMHPQHPLFPRNWRHGCSASLAGVGEIRQRHRPLGIGLRLRVGPRRKWSRADGSGGGGAGARGRVREPFSEGAPAGKCPDRGPRPPEPVFWDPGKRSNMPTLRTACSLTIHHLSLGFLFRLNQLKWAGFAAAAHLLLCVVVSLRSNHRSSKREDAL